jgi:type IV pilus assembly protein PilN
MPHINLLPWREELRQQRNKEFGFTAAVGVVVMAAVVAVVHLHFKSRIMHQNDRNGFLEANIAILDKRIKEIQQLDDEKERLLARMQIIQRLQSSRPEVVHLFDELVQTLPEGVYFTRIQQKGRVLNIHGVAQSNARVSSLMRQLDSSDWLENPSLLQITARVSEASNKQQGVRMSNFQLNVSQEDPAKAAAVEEK